MVRDDLQKPVDTVLVKTSPDQCKQQIGKAGT